jgi:hypothetical protein
MKESGNKSVANMFAALIGTKKGDTDDKEGAEKSDKVKVPFYELNQEERMIYHRIKSAKNDKKQAEELKNKREELDWKIQQSHQKIISAQQRKKMKDQEEEAQRE